MSVACCLNERWYVKPDRELPKFGTPTAQAFRTEDVGDLKTPYVALICDPKLPSRLDIVAALQKLASPHLVTPVDQGPVIWTPGKRRCRIIVFPEPRGERLIQTAAEPFTPWSEQEILAIVVMPLLELLLAMQQAGVTHRGIRADNLFIIGTGGQRKIMLHECVSVPPAFDAPPAYLTIEDAQADPHGRSNGGIAEELYALGVLILHLLTGRLPAGGATAQQVMEAKLDSGSYDTLVGGEELPPRSAELLRGLLADRRAERWTIADIADWLDGRSPRPRAAAPIVRRPLEIEGKSFRSVPALVHWLVGAEERLLARALRHQDMIPWLTAALNNPRTIERFRNLVSSGESQGRDSASLLARVAIMLDPTGPIRYQQISCAVDGIASEIAIHLLRGSAAEPKLLSELITARLPQFSAASQAAADSRMSDHAFTVEKTCRYLTDSRVGNGIERAGYELVPGLHCLSPAVEREFAVDLGELLTALEAAVRSGTIQGWPIDRHIAAFIAARSPESVDDQLGALDSGDLARRWGATTRLLAGIQDRHGPEALPSLCRLLADHGMPLIDRFHNRATRKRIRGQLGEILKAGRLSRLAKELDDRDALERDRLQFERACTVFKGTEQRLLKCDQVMEGLIQTAKRMGDAVSVVVATALSVGILLFAFAAMVAL